MWLRRLQRPGVYDPYNKYYQPNGTFNIYTGSVRMPNCTAYAYIRAQEAERLVKRDPYLINSSGGFGNAKTGYATTSLPKGSILREGAIAVFDGNCGHVAIVEKKINDHHAILSESNYDDDKSRRDWKYWQIRECDLYVGKSTISGIGPLIGYIYLDINDRRVSRDSNRDQVRVNYDYINIRVSPGLDSLKYDGCFCPDGIYNVLNLQEADGYTWYKLDDDCGIAGVEEVEYLPKEGDEDMTILQPDQRDESKNQIYVGNFYLNVRDEADVNSNKTGQCEPNSYYDVLDMSTKEDYTWYHLGPDSWVAGVEGVVYIPAKDESDQDQTPSDTSELIKEIKKQLKETQDKIKQLDSKNAKLEAEIAKKDKRINQLEEKLDKIKELATY